MRNESVIVAARDRLTRMSTYETYDLATYWPTSGWLERYRAALNDNDELAESGSGWGVGWNGDFVFEIRNLPVDDRTIGDLPEEIWGVLQTAIENLDEGSLESVVATAPEPVRADIESRDGSLTDRTVAELRETPVAEAPDRVWPEFERLLPDLHTGLLAEVEENVDPEGTVYAFIGLEDGACTGVDVLDAADEREYGIRVHGDYFAWKDLVRGELDIIQAVMGGKLELDGDMQRVLTYTDAAQAMTQTAADLDDRFLF